MINSHDYAVSFLAGYRRSGRKSICKETLFTLACTLAYRNQPETGPISKHVIVSLLILKNSGRIGINCWLIYVILAHGLVQTVQRCFAAGISRRLLQIF